MKTFSFIGSDKNAGKTTSFNFVINQLVTKDKEQGSSPLLLTSIGLNGETSDNYEGHGKPTIAIPEGHYFLTSGEHLSSLSGNYQTIRLFAPPLYKKTFVLGRAITSFELILEGPNEKSELVLFKKEVEKFLPTLTILIDGSIDRQCIASPEISDAFYFALLLSNRPEQLKKAKDLLEPLFFESLNSLDLERIKASLTSSVKSLLIEKNSGAILHASAQIPFLDDDLKYALEESGHKNCLLYLGGALTPSLYALLSPYKNLTVVLDNFTLYHNITVKSSFDRRVFFPRLSLLTPIKVQNIFIKDEGGDLGLDLSRLPIRNIFRQELL